MRYQIVKSFDVQIEHDNESGYWFAECNQLGLVTEAENLDALTNKVQKLAPDMAIENGFNNKSIQLHLEYLAMAS